MKKLMRRFLGILLQSIVVTLIFVFCLIGCADRLIFQPPPQRSETGPGMQLVNVAPNIQVAVLLLLADDPGAPVLLYCHGNATDLFELEEYLQEYPSHGFSIAALDYEGYGASSRTAPSEGHCYRDAEAVYRWLTTDLRIPPKQIIAYGHSVGSGPACYLAEKYPLGGLILEAPFLSAFRVVTSVPLPFDRFQNWKRMSAIRVPVLIMHGLRDTVIAPSHGKELWERANSPRYWWPIPEAGHDDIPWIAGSAYWDALKRFVTESDQR